MPDLSTFKWLGFSGQGHNNMHHLVFKFVDWVTLSQLTNLGELQEKLII